MEKFRKFFPLALIGFFLLVFLITPQIARAEVSFWPTGYWATDGLVPPQCQEQFCQSLCDFLDLGQRVVYFALTILLFIIVPIMVMWGGLTLLTGRGSTEGLSRGKKILTGAIIGAAIGVGSFLIINIFISALGLIAGEGQGKIGWGTVTCTPPPMASTGTDNTGNIGNSGTGGDNGTGGHLPGGLAPNCPTCEKIVSPPDLDIDAFIFKNGNQAAPRMVERLQCFARDYRASGGSIVRITEAFPPSSQHQSSRHYNGCAVDMTPPQGLTVTQEIVNRILGSAGRCGLRALNEYVAFGGSATEFQTGGHVHLELTSGCP